MNAPKWQKEVEAQYNAKVSNAFILTGNIGDYTRDTVLLLDYIREWAVQRMKFNEVITYNPYDLGYDVISKKGKMDFPTIIEKIRRPNGNSCIIFSYPEYMIPAGDFLQENEKQQLISMHSVLNSATFMNSDNLVVFITESASNINTVFLSNNCRISLINLELPDISDRYDFIDEWYRTYPAKKQNTVFDGVNINTIANLTAGLTLLAIEDILLMASREKFINTKRIMDKKKEIIQKQFGEVVEIFDTEGLSLNQFAGQEGIKGYFREVVIDAIKYNQLDIVPKGIMLMGPPGTGKTYFAKCLAADSGISFVEFKISKILGKYVGESEKSMEKALSVFRALAPVGVFMDEIDQAMSRGKGGSDGGSQVSANIFGMLLAEMSKPSNRGRIIWLAATNYPNNVDEALKRPGRFDKKIPFFAPTEEERKFVFELHLKGKVMSGNAINMDKLVENTKGYTQAEIEAIVVKALELSKRAKRTGIIQQDLDRAMSYMLSNQNEKIKEMEDIALKECNDQEFIPKEYRERQRELMNRNSYSESMMVNRGSD